MSRGRGGSYSGGRSQGFDDLVLNFDLFPLDVDENEITPDLTTSQIFALNENNLTANDITNYTFTNVIENFSATYEAGEEAFAFAPLGELINTESLVGTLTLDLTARYLPEGSILTLPDGRPIFGTDDFNGDGILNDVLTAGEDRIEYIISGSELEAIGITDIAFIIEDADALRVGSETFDIRPVLQIEGQKSRVSFGVDVDIDGDGISERIIFKEEFIKIEEDFYPVLEGSSVGSEGEFIVFPNSSGENILVPLQGDFGNEFIEIVSFGSPSTINSNGRFIRGQVFGGGEEFFQVEGDFLEIDGDTVEIQGDLGEEFIEFRGEIIELDSEFLADSFFSVDTGNNIEVGGDLILDTETERIDATSNLESIVDLIGFANSIRISGGSFEDPNIIVGDEDPNASIDATILIEAEDLNLAPDGYSIEDYREGEEGDQLISLLDAPRESGKATGTASIEARDLLLNGNYNLTISYFDENDGDLEDTAEIEGGQIEVLVNGTPQEIMLDDGSMVNAFILNEDPAGGLPSEANRREFSVALNGIGLEDTITIKGTSSLDEQTRIDFITFDEAFV